MTQKSDFLFPWVPTYPDDMTDQARGLHARVLESLGPAITGGEYPPGSVLRTDELSQRFEVSRSVVREAVRVLESMHLVESRRRVGVTVRPTEEWNVYDPQVIRWRLMRRRPAAPVALPHGPSLGDRTGRRRARRPARHPEQCAALTECALGMVATSRGQQLEGYLFHDINFHRIVLNASGNEMFARLGDVVAEVLAGRTHHQVMFEDPDPAAVTLHVRLAEAVREGDAARAEELTREIAVGALHELDILAP